MERVIFVVWGEEDENIYENQLPKYFLLTQHQQMMECEVYVDLSNKTCENRVNRFKEFRMDDIIVR